MKPSTRAASSSESSAPGRDLAASWSFSDGLPDEGVGSVAPPGAEVVVVVAVDVAVTVVVAVAVVVVGTLGASAARLTTTPDAVAGSEASGVVLDGGGVPADGAGVMVAVGSVGVAVDVVDGDDESLGVSESLGVRESLGVGESDVVSADAVGTDVATGDSLPGGDPCSVACGRRAGSDHVGAGDSVELESPGRVIGANVIVAIAVPSSLLVDDGVSLGVLTGDVSVGAQVGRCAVPCESPRAPGWFLGAAGCPAGPAAACSVAPAVVDGEDCAPGSLHGPPPSPALAPFPGSMTARVIAAATQSAAANAPRIRLRRVIRPAILCVQWPCPFGQGSCVPRVHLPNEAAGPAVRPLLARPEQDSGE